MVLCRKAVTSVNRSQWWVEICQEREILVFKNPCLDNGGHYNGADRRQQFPAHTVEKNTEALRNPGFRIHQKGEAFIPARLLLYVNAKKKWSKPDLSKGQSPDFHVEVDPFQCFRFTRNLFLEPLKRVESVYTPVKSRYSGH